MTNSKSNISAQKLRGGYYTPSSITKFLCQWAIDYETSKILEPSCGDGNFVESAIDRLKEIGKSNQQINSSIRAIELLDEEANKAKTRVKKAGCSTKLITNSDFFHYVENHSQEKYDAILGNPPFIRYQNFPQEHRSLAIRLMNDLGLSPNKLTNIWVPFLVISASMLTPNGKLAMVIPTELFQVKYAGETRVFLSKFFDRINIITFKNLVFKGIQQEVVLLLCEKAVSHGKGIRTIECDNLKGLLKLDFSKINGTNVKSVQHDSEKWTKYFLTESEIKLLRKLKSDKRVIPCSDLMLTNVGVVTGRNDFFLMQNSQKQEWGLSEYTAPVVGRSNHLKGIRFTKKDFEKNSDAEYPVYLFLPKDAEISRLPRNCQKYIRYGEDKKFHTGYKCRIRKHWYITPSLWVPDAFALRQIHDYPKLIVNETEAQPTDTVHRVKFHEGVDPKTVAMTFLNSLSFAFSEITGRSYGGGVLTFEPTEIGEIPIPRIVNTNLKYSEIDELIRAKKISEVLDLVDNEILVKQLKFTRKEVSVLRGIWEKLRDRRLNRK